MDLKKKISEYFHCEGFKKKFIVMLLGVVLMGIFLSFLINVSLGTDPCTFMNLTISRRLGFVVAASLYMNADMGVAPYDAVPIILSNLVLKKFLSNLYE